MRSGLEEKDVSVNVMMGHPIRAASKMQNVPPPRFAAKRQATLLCGAPGTTKAATIPYTGTLYRFRAGE
jgi:hypothetical protein